MILIFLLLTLSYVLGNIELFDQAHLSFTGGDDTTMGLDFISVKYSSSLKVQYRLKSDAQNYNEHKDAEVLVVQTNVVELNNVGYAHNTEMVNLKESSNYEYRVINDDVTVTSEWVSFATSPYIHNKKGETAAVFADFGLTNDVSMKFIVEDEDVDYFLHAGDFAYDFESDSSKTGNKFMHKLHARTKHLPYMPVPGNHEVHSSKVNGSEYIQRFRGVYEHAGIRSKSNSNFFYSYDRGLIHYVMIDTEIWRWGEEIHHSLLPHTIQQQLDWLEEDLKAVDRSKTPWIVAMGHKAWYMSRWEQLGELEKPQTNWPVLDPIFCKYGVELYLSGHVHLYQRFYPLQGPESIKVWTKPQNIDIDSVSEDGHTYTNPQWMTTLIVASPGDDEIAARNQCWGKNLPYKHNPFTNTMPVCTNGYGYGHLHAVNSTHLYWEFFQTAKAPNWNQRGNDDAENFTFKEKRRRDHLWLVVEKHGNRDYC